MCDTRFGFHPDSIVHGGELEGGGLRRFWPCGILFVFKAVETCLCLSPASFRKGAGSFFIYRSWPKLAPL